MKVCICGGRAFDDMQSVADQLDALHRATPIDVLMQGGAQGADSLGYRWATHRKIGIQSFDADWSLHGKAAGPIRNQRMIDQKPDIVIAFPGGKGTADMVKRAKAAGIRVIEVKERP